MDFLHLSRITLAFGPVPVLSDINFKISQGEFVAIVGPSGCGKSSLLKLVTGIEAPSSGTIHFQGDTITGLDPRRGMMFQEATLFPWLTVRENITFGLKMQGTPRQERLKQSDYYLELMDLSDFADHLPYQLSGGMKQRTALARTLINRPKIVMMDEPFSALDAITRKNMQKLLHRIWKNFNTTFLFVTHDVEEAVHLGSRVIVLSSRPARIMEDLTLSSKHARESEIIENIYKLLEK